MTEQKPPMNWPTAITLVALFATFAAVVWALAYVITS